MYLLAVCLSWLQGHPFIHLSPLMVGGVIEARLYTVLIFSYHYIATMVVVI